MNKSEYIEAIRLLNRWSKAYYASNTIEASDDEYDKLYRQVIEFEEKHPECISNLSPSNRVGEKPIDKFKKSNHIEKMFSMEDVFCEKELDEWLKRVCKNSLSPSFFCEPKFDGISLNLLYDKGYLKKALTRGDGSEGEDVTQNAKTIKTIPLSINCRDLIEIRGEVIIKNSYFNLLNRQRSKENKPIFINPRNVSSGSLRQLNASITAKRNLLFYPWGVGYNELNIDKLSKIMSLVRSFGFLKPPISKICKSKEQIIDFYNSYITKKRDSTDLNTDGIVIKVDEIEEQIRLGNTIKNPRWMCAFKFPPIEKTTKLKKIEIQVGRTGVLTPIAILEPIKLSGATIKRVTLHNFSEIDKKDIMINDTVCVIRSGDVIPKITKSLSSRRDNTQKRIKKPINCPICNSKLLSEDIKIKCQNLACPARVISGITHFCSKPCMNIDGLGVKIVSQLYNNAIITDIMDLYNLSKERLLKLDNFKDKKALNIINSIENSKGVELHRFINALGIDHVGTVASKILSEKFGYGILYTKQDDMLRLDSIGESSSKSISNFMNINREKIKMLMDIIKPIVPTLESTTKSIFTNKRVVLTGIMSKPRDQIKTLLQKYGASITSAVSKNTNFLIYGHSPGSKYTKALNMGIKTMNEDEMNKKISKYNKE